MSSGFTRRDFLQSAAATTALAVLPPAVGASRAFPRVRVAVLFEPGFPAIDTPPVRRDGLGAALDGFDLTFLGAGDLDGLSPDRCDVYVNPYGSAFPKDAWPGLLAYLDAGGSWVNLGGVPCAVPAVRSDAGWRPDARQTGYHHRLGVTLGCAVATDGVRAWRANEALPWTSGLAARLGADTVWELYYRLSSVADTPDEAGSAGAMEAVVRPLVTGLDAAGRAVAAPLVMLDRLEGEFAGGRWIFATLDGPVAPATLRTLVEAAATGSRRFEARPSLACYRAGEAASISLTYRAPRAGSAALAAPCAVAVFDAGGRRVAQVEAELRGDRSSATGTVDLSAVTSGPLPPGLYRVDATLTLAGTASLESELRHRTGFWVWDEALLASGAPLGVGEFSLTRRGAPYLVTGTTYMASDVHRKFLLEPNPWLWDRDFAEMKRAGINLVRTGLWTGWRTLMPRVGALDEGALRALDAYLLTARRHDMPVIFTLFAFLPEPWGGENPYLDPRAVEAQRRFVATIVRRYARMHDVLWDLINEPSFCNQDHLWSCRPNYDRVEREAWSAWLRARLPAATAAELAELPRLEEFAERAGADDAASRKVVEYRLFAQAMFARWAREMRAALREAGASRQLVTVGQDEAGTRDSPNNLFLAPELDFTCVHNWWLNDALVWDGVITRAPGKANLVEETGVMFSGRPAGGDERWESYARDLLERKMALSVGPAGAGFVEWVWNSNCYMPSDNEAAIGLLRADGTAKPELGALQGVAEFVAQAGPHLVGRRPDPVLLLVPHGNMFSRSNTATDATRRAVRVMQYRCRVSLAAVSEYAATAAMRVPPLVLVPAPRALRTEAWDAATAWARRGAVVLLTGPLEGAERLGPGSPGGPPGLGAVRIPLGRGALLWSARPVELSSDEEEAAALYGWALGEARVAPSFTAAGAGPSVLVHAAVFRRAVLFTLANETDREAGVRLVHHESGATLEQVLRPWRAAMLLADRRSGRVLARYPAS
jgi:hypothetical protein